MSLTGANVKGSNVLNVGRSSVLVPFEKTGLALEEIAEIVAYSHKKEAIGRRRIIISRRRESMHLLIPKK